MYVAGDPSLGLVALTCLGGALSAGGAGAINHALDRDLDRVMKRTADRPGGVRPGLAAGGDRRSASLLGCASFALLGADGEPAGRRAGDVGPARLRVRLHDVAQAPTPQNIVIGGAAGAVPPLVAWAAVTGGLGGTPLYLFAIVFFWTPPHFWSLSLLMKDDYARAGVPMLPVVRGEAETRRQILLYTRAALRGQPAALLRRRVRRHLPGLLGARWERRSSPARTACCAAPTAAPRCASTCSRWPTWRCCSARWSPTRGCRAVAGPWSRGAGGCGAWAVGLSGLWPTGGAGWGGLGVAVSQPRLAGGVVGSGRAGLAAGGLLVGVSARGSLAPRCPTRGLPAAVGQVCWLRWRVSSRPSGSGPASRPWSARITCMTALISARWVNAWGKLPRWRPERGSISSAYSPSGDA